MSLLYILGRQSSIGLAELESVYGATSVTALPGAAIISSDYVVDFDQLGGSVKCAQILHTAPTTDIKKLQQSITDTLVGIASQRTEGKFVFGLSFYGLTISPKRITAIGLTAKKEIKQHSPRSPRLTSNTEEALSSAQVFHNQLTHPNHCELILFKKGSHTIIAQTTNVQDIDAYTLRDRSRPKRDARVGMLPPKLAQIIINLASQSSSKTILDPFCGTGVLLNEALLQNYSVYGTDIEQRMIDYSQANIEWLHTQYTITRPHTLHQGDATSVLWQTPFDTVASETYLGRPFTSPPSQELLQKNRNDCDTIHRKFLKNLAAQTKPGFRACIAVPAWFVGSQIYHLKTLDYLEEIGYNRMSFVHASQKELIYHREGQIVGRELVVITRK